MGLLGFRLLAGVRRREHRVLHSDVVVTHLELERVRCGCFFLFFVPSHAFRSQIVFVGIE